VLSKPPLLLKRIFLSFLLLSTFLALGQLPAYTLYYTNPLPINPAFTGSAHKFRAGINFRNQWTEFISPVTAYSLYADNYFGQINSSIGISVYSDVTGFANYRTTQIAAYYAFSAKLSDNVYLKSGVQPSYNIAGSDQGSLVFNDQLTASGTTGTATAETLPLGTKVQYANLGAGVLLTAGSVYVGASGYNLLMPRTGYSTNSKLPIGFGIQAGGKFDFMADQISRKEKKERFLMPHLAFVSVGNSNMLFAGTELAYAPFSIGGLLKGNFFSKADGISNMASFAVSVGFRKKEVQANYAYEFPITNKAKIIGPSHEISVRTTLKIWQKPSRRKIERLDLF
jgi:type IX secretion system PorP/SprF family membrane protein